MLGTYFARQSAWLAAMPVGGWPVGKKIMNMLTAKGFLNIARGKIKQNIATLFRDERRFLEGKEAELVGRIQQRAGKKRGKFSRTSVPS